MAFFQWRKFNFFSLVKDVDGGGLAAQLGQDNVITCVCSGRGAVTLGDLQGSVWRVINRHWTVERWPGWEGKVEELVQPRQSPHLLGLGLQADIRCLKVWSLGRVDGDGRPELVRVSRLARPGCPAEPVCIAASECQQLLAAGYEDGAVGLWRGDWARERGHRLTLLLEPGPHQLAGLALRQAEQGPLLYLATSRDVMLWRLGEKGREERTTLDTIGTTRGLCAAPVNYADTHFVTGQTDAVYCYNPEGRGQCYAFEGRKRLLHWNRGCLTVLSDEGADKATVTVFDVQNKFIGFSAPIKPVLAVVSEWGSIFLVTEEGRLHQFVEKDIQEKMSILFKKNFYDVAIKIAKNQQYDAEGLVDIFRLYGDHLYAKGDQTGAIEQYIKTIGSLEPSYVIQKFLDAQKIHNLTAYLAALHRAGLASEDHTTLLLNCYTKLKDSSMLDEFIMTKDREIDFDVDIAISVCRQAGYSRHALALAEKHAKHELYLSIVLESEGDPAGALQYLTSLQAEQAAPLVRKHGAALVRLCPGPATTLIASLCPAQADPHQFLPFFIDNEAAMLEFLELVAAAGAGGGPEVQNTLLECLLSRWAESEAGTRAGQEGKIMELLRREPPPYSREQALVLCRQTGFSPGLLYLYQQCGHYDQILTHHLAAGDRGAGLAACRRFGPQQPGLWVAALQSIGQGGGEVGAEQLQEVLDNVERYRLLSPLQVVSTLASCPTATLAAVRQFLLRTLAAEQRSEQEDRRVIAQYQADNKALREKLDKLNNSVTVFQSTKCAACNHSLELPTVHFLCQHGYHQQCFQSYSDNEQECPVCHSENKKILDILRCQEQGRAQHDQFHQQLEKAEDGFSIVAEYLGRGMFTQPVRLPELPPQQPAGQQLPAQLAGLTVSEARLRANQGRASPELTAVSEGRLRAGERSAVAAGPSEGRVRSSQPSQAALSVPSDARVRLAERSGAGSLTANLSPPANLARPAQSGSAETVVPRREDIAPANPFSDSNPFGSPADNSLGSDNPFASSAGTSPVRQPASPDNPFGEDVANDYNEELNPFA